MNSFSIIIVTWNALDLLKQYLPSVAKTNYPDFEIIIADNASSDGSKEWVRSHYPNVKIASFDQNYGYCGGNNRAVPFAEKDILLFLNNDVKVDPNWLHALNEAFQDKGVAAAQPKIRSVEKPEYFEYAGAAGGFIDRYGYPFCRGRIFDEVEKDEGQYDDECPIFWASGAALAVRKTIFLEQQGFDEDFEFHMEEIDLCWRIQNQGKEIRYVPASTVYHLGGGSLPMGSPRKMFYNFRNSLYMLWKNYSTASLLKYFLIRLLLDVIAATKELLSGSPRLWWAVVRAHWHFLGKLPHIHQKRRQLQKKRTHTDNPKTMAPFSIVWQYFVKKKSRYSSLF